MHSSMANTLYDSDLKIAEKLKFATRHIFLALDKYLVMSSDVQRYIFYTSNAFYSYFLFQDFLKLPISTKIDQKHSHGRLSIQDETLPLTLR